MDGSIVTHDMKDVTSDKEDDDHGVLIPRGGTRVGGWGSPSDSDGMSDTLYATKVVGEPKNGDSPGNAVRESGARSSSRVTSTYASTAKAAAAPKAEERLQQQPKDRLEQMMDTTVGGAPGQWSNRRPSKTMSRTHQATTFQSSPHQSLSSSLQQQEEKSKEQQQARSRRRRASSDAACGGFQSQEDRDDDSFEDGLVISSAFPSRLAGGGGGAGAGCVSGGGGGGGGGITAGGRGERVEGQTVAAVVVAPFHGPLPVSLAFGSGPEALPSVPAIGDGRNGKKRSNAPITDLAAVRGVSIQQPAQPKGHRSQNDNHNKQPPSNRDPPGFGSAASSAEVGSTTTWDGVVTGRSAVAGGGGAGHGARIERGARNNSDTSVGTACVGLPAPSAGAGAGFPLDATESSASHPAGTFPNGRNVDGDFSMGISGTGVALPWRKSSRRHAPTASVAAAGASAGGGENRRRMRREQARTSANPGVGGIAGLTWGDDGVNVDPDISKVSRTITDRFEGERRHRGGGGGSGDVNEIRVGPDEDRPVAGAGVHAEEAEAGNAGGSGARAEEEMGARSGSTTKGWRAAGDSLAHLKARMGVRHRQHPATAAEASASAARGGGAAGVEGNATEGMGDDRGPHHIPYHAF